MKSYVYKVVVEEDQHEDGSGAYQAYCPAIEEAVTWGDTKEEAMQRINELVHVLVQMRVENGQPIPKDIVVELESIAVTV